MTTTDMTTGGPIPSTFVVPETGEAVNTSDEEQMRLVAQQSPDVIGLMLETIDSWISEAQHARRYIGEYLIERMDQDATQTLHAGPYTMRVNGGSNETEVFDADKLDASLARMVASGVITEAAWEKAIRVKREVSKTGLNSLRALRNGDIDAAIEDATSMEMRPRRVSVKRA